MSASLAPALRQLAAALLVFGAVSAQAASIVVNSHFLQADTSASAEQELRTNAVDDVRFDDALVSQGLGGQGGTGSARAAQNVLFDAQRGANGFVESSVALGSGISGSAQSLLFVAFDIADLSGFALDGQAAVEGNALSTQRLRLLLDVVGGDFVEIFDVELSTPAFNLAGLLDPGRYLLSVSTQTASADPGESGLGRIDFDFRFDAVPGGNTVPEPGSLALATAALALLAAGSRAGRPGRAT